MKMNKTLFAAGLVMAGCGGMVVDDPGEVDGGPDVDAEVAPPAPGTAVWAIGLGDSDLDRGTDIVVDPDGSIVVVGEFRGELELADGTALVSAGMGDLFVARRAGDGSHRDGARFGGDADDTAPRVARLPSGNLALTATFAGTTDLGGMTADGPIDGLVAVVTASLTRIWSAPLGGFYIDSANAVAGDLAGNVVVGGTFAYQLDVGTESFAGDGLDGYVARFAGGGGFGWADAIGGGTAVNGPNDLVTAIATDAAGNVYAAGMFTATSQIGGESHTAQGPHDSFLIKYDPTGAPAWIRTLSGPANEEAAALAVDAAGNVTLAVRWSGATAVVRHDASGALIWQRQIAATVTDLQVSADGIDVVGSFSGDLQLSADVAVSSAGGTDALVVNLTDDGAVMWAGSFGGEADDVAAAVGLAPDGELVITGSFAGTAGFGGTELASAGGTDAFVARLGR